MTEMLGDATLPPVVIEAAHRMMGRTRELTVAMADMILTHESVYRDLYGVPREDLERSCEDHLSWVLGEMVGQKRDTRTARAVGRRRAEQGVPLRALLHAYRLGARFVANAMLRETEGVLHSEFVLSTVNMAWEMLEEYTETVTSAYLDATNAQTRRDTESRGAMIAALFSGDLTGPAALAEGAAVLGLPLEGSFVVATIEGSPDGRTADDRVRAAGIVSAWHRELDTFTGVMVVPPRGRIDAVLTHLSPRGGEKVGLSGVFADLALTATAAGEARLALATAATGDLVSYDDAPLPVLLVSAPAAAANVVSSVLGPLLALPERERETLLDTLRAWFANEGSAAKTAAAMFVHRNTIGYRAQQIETLTGRRLTDGRDAAELYIALEAQRLKSVQA